MKTERYDKSVQWRRWHLRVSRHINTRCASLGFCVSWGRYPGVEVDFLFWCFDLEHQPKPRNTNRGMTCRDDKENK